MTLAYVLPFAVWMAGVQIRNTLGESGFWVYPIQTIVVAGILVAFRKNYHELKPKVDWIALGAGLLVFAIWVGLDPYLPHFERKNAVFLDSKAPWEICTWMSFRLLGASLIIPVAEELFWRSFLTRWIIDPQWTKVPLGKFSWISFVCVALLFGFEHKEWASGIIAGAAFAGLLYWRKNLFSCVLAHATTNLLLGAYVIYTKSWQFW